MTMKKITLSVLAAGMLFGTDIMARDVQTGVLSLTGDKTEPNGVSDKITVASELVTASELNTTNIPMIDISNLDTNDNGIASTLVFKTSIGGSGTVSDPVFKYRIPSLAPLASTDLKIVEVNSTGGIITDNVAALSADPEQDGIYSILTFEGNDNVNVYDSKLYAIVKDDNSSADLNISINKDLADSEISVELYSTSGTEEKVTEAALAPFEIKPQFEFVCDSKLDALINVENGSKNFVPTRHGVQTYNSEVSLYDTDIDALNFSVINSKTASDIEFAMDGKGTLVKLYPTALSADNNYSNMFNSLDLELTNIDTGDVVGGGDAHYDDNRTSANDFISFKFNETIADGKTRYSGTIKTDMEAGLLPTAWSAEALVDNNDSLAKLPNAAGNPTTAEVGEWQNYVYIAQIAGATNDDSTKTKLFITNRSCKAVSPVVKFIYEGKVLELTAPSVAVNAQSKILVDTLVDENSAAFDAAGIPTRARYAIEIVIPGNAEDFYVYAQAQNRTTVEATKDLPVYNTSTRTY